MPFNNNEHDDNREKNTTPPATQPQQPLAHLPTPTPAMPVQLKGISVRVDPPKMLKAPSVPAAAVAAADSTPQDNLRRTGACADRRSIDLIV